MYSVKTEIKDEIEPQPSFSNSINSIQNESPKKSMKREMTSNSLYVVKISNFPSYWVEDDLRKYLKSECDWEGYLTFSKGCARLKVSSKYRDAISKIHGNNITGHKLVIDIKSATEDCETVEEPSNKRIKSKSESSNVSKRAEFDVWDEDPKGLYGLKRAYLQSLGIIPPINRWVYVTNFRCDKQELKEVMELAGEVLICNVVRTVPRYATVMYSHPLEAVQAVSMLNDQTFYGQVLKINISANKTIPILPKGLDNIGPGLGKSGMALRDIVRQYERYAKGLSSDVNEMCFKSDNEDSSDAESNGTTSTVLIPHLNVNQEDYFLESTESTSAAVTQRLNLKTQICDPRLNRKTQMSETLSNDAQNMSTNKELSLNTNFKKANELIPYPARPMSSGVTQMPSHAVRSDCPFPDLKGPNLRPNIPTGSTCPIPTGSNSYGYSSNQSYNANPIYGPGNQFGSSATGPFPIGSNGAFNGPREQGPYGPNNASFGSSDKIISRRNSNSQLHDGSCMLEFKNLPLTVTLPEICQKVSLCGQVVSVQFIGPGQATVSFAHRSQAENCIQRFNNASVGNNILQVRYV